MENAFFLVIGGFFGAFVGYLIARIWYFMTLKKTRQHAVTQSKATTLGYVHEKIAPLLPDFPYSFKDLVYLGKGVDYIVFDGLSSGVCNKVVFLEIKTSKSQLNKNEKNIQKAIDEKKVSYEVVRLQY